MCGHEDCETLVSSGSFWIANVYRIYFLEQSIRRTAFPWRDELP
jgi:hypothetical protein